MEEIQRMEEEEERSGRWTTILLIIGNVAIWGLVALILFTFNMVLTNAQTLNVNNTTNYIYHCALANSSNCEFTEFSSSTTLALTRKPSYIMTQWNGLQGGAVNGVYNVTFTNVPSGTTCNQLKTGAYVVENDVRINASIQYTNCNISNNTAQLQIRFNNNVTGGTNSIFRVVYPFPVSFVGGTYTSAGNLYLTTKDYATNEDIENQTVNIINNAIQNAVDIITNQNTAIGGLIESQKVCKKIDKNNIVIDNKVININGEELPNYGNYGITDYYSIVNSTITRTVPFSVSSSESSICFYNINKTVISCIKNTNLTENIIIPNNSSYVRFSIQKNLNEPQFEICTYGNQAITDSINQSINNSTNYFTQMIEKIDRIATAINPSRLWTDIPPDDSDFQTTHAMEEDILDMAGDIDLDDVTIDLDTESSNWVWTTLTSLINTSSLVFSMFISILSIGIIKLLFNR